MDPSQNNVNTVPPTPEKPIDKATEEANKEYADALLKMVNLDYAEQHPEQAKRSQPFSTNQMIFFTIIIIVTVAGVIAYEKINKTSSSSSSSTQSTDQTKQLVHSAETFGNPSSY